MFKVEAGKLDIPHIPYKGSAPAMNDLLGNQIGMVVDTLGTSLSQYRGGKVRILASGLCETFKLGGRYSNHR